MPVDWYNWLIHIVGRVFFNGPGERGSIPGGVLPKIPKMVLDACLLNSQQHKAWIKGNAVQSNERSSSFHLWRSTKSLWSQKYCLLISIASQCELHFFCNGVKVTPKNGVLLTGRYMFNSSSDKLSFFISFISVVKRLPTGGVLIKTKALIIEKNY